ncbi:MAG: ribonuclease HII [Bacilli bacterium]|nr:ribonuclease HII [Acholeplasmataceae bacterium]MDY2902256.1 ribonuclease HII [Bacilli bacterium]
MLDLYKYENELKAKGYKIIAGTDEVGRGPMAGPVVVASVVLDDNNFIEGLNDSKKLTPKKRKELSEIIKAKALDYSITFIPVEEVDRINVLEASRKGMMECIRKLKVKVDYVLSDAVKLDFEFPCLNIIKGDSKSASIAAASIVAKVARDEYMDELDKDFPMYGFKKHKGYVTKYHLNAIDKYGVCIHHRKSFAPVQKIIERDKKTLV